MDNSLLRAAALTALLGLTACDGLGGGDTDGDQDEAASAIPVEVSLPVRGDIYSRYSGTSPIEALAEATVVAKVGGEIIDLLVEEGDDVEQGQLLARLDGDRLRLELAGTRARLEKLKQDFARNVELRERSLISAGDFETIQYEMEALKAANELAELELNYTEIRAPIDGVVTERLIKPGNTIEVGTPAFQITSLEPLISYLHVPEREYGRMQAGLSAEITVDALPEARFTGTVARTSPVVDPTTGTFKLTLEIPDPSGQLKPGMFGRISIVSDRRENVLRVPRNAIVDESGEPYVFVVSGDVVEQRYIETGFTDGPYMEVREGLSDGERLVVVGQSSLKDGTTVAVVETTSSRQATDSNEPR